MDYYVMTLFPEQINNILNESITGRAIEKGILNVEAVDIRDYAQNRYKHVDDYIYGGGSGMLIQAEPVYLCYKDILEKYNTADESTRVLYMSPQGKRFDQKMASELSKEKSLIFLCGHYEGIDERALELLHVEEVSLGDFVLTGGEIAAAAMIDCISRLVPGVLGNEESSVEESFSGGLLEYPQYTRPAEYMGLKVPEVLLSGNHALIKKWREDMARERTKEKRPDLLIENASQDNDHDV